MVNKDELIDEAEKTSVNHTGSRKNYIMILLKALEFMHKGDIFQFMYQDLELSPNLQYPSFVPKEIAKQMKKSTVIDNNSYPHDKIKDFVVKQTKSCEVIEEKKKYL